MISVKKAQDLILENAFRLESERVTLIESRGRVLAADIVSPVSHPLFDQTAVDGYAFRFEDFKGAKTKLHICVEIKAGDFPETTVNRGEVARIFTGAAIPNGADTVVMQEFTVQDENMVVIDKSEIKKGAHIRRTGEQIRDGETALQKGTELNAVSIGFLASLGIASVNAFRLPKVSIVVTGNEFANSPEELEKGKIFESNGIMLQTALNKMGIESSYRQCEDNPEKLGEVIQQQSEENDVLLVTGGVSVGDYDFTKPVLEQLGFETVFHKIAQKPGKPLLFSRKGRKAAFGLPGNPRSVMVCFYEYVYPFLQAIQGNALPFLSTLKLPLSHDFNKKDDGKTHFLAGKFTKEGVEILDGQDSHMLRSLSLADGLVVLFPDKTQFSKGDAVKTHEISK
ncbi:MAG: molybdopterin molybdenumtransferase [Flavobacteriales bacterium]|nr:MAG: molybdopterin molybdenumtransferase [Flavobacteriales bacterium]